MSVQDIFTLQDEDAALVDQVAAMQRMIDAGTVWSFEGSMGRAAMSMIEEGYCILPSVYIDETMQDTELTPAIIKRIGKENLKAPIRDAYGSIVPYRELLEDGTKGTLSYARRHQPEFWEGRTPGYWKVDGVRRELKVTKSKRA